MRQECTQTQDTFVHAKHDGGARDGPEKVGSQATVEAEHAFLLEDEPKTLDETGVLETAVRHGGLS